MKNLISHTIKFNLNIHTSLRKSLALKISKAENFPDDFYFWNIVNFSYKMNTRVELL